MKINVSGLQAQIKRILSPGKTLSQRVVRGAIWAFALRAAERLFSLLRIIVLARLLAPQDFGLFGITALAMSMLETFSYTGFSWALIQKKGDIRPYLDTAWTVQVIRGATLAGILFITAPYIATFFAAPEATFLLQIAGLSTFIGGLANIGVIYFWKNIDFRKQFAYEISGIVANLVVAVILAILLRNVWALIYGLLARSFIQAVMSYFIHPFRPKFHLEFMKAKELHNFGRWVFLSGVIVLFLKRLSDVFIGKILGVTMLGFYRMACQIGDLSTSEITKSLSRVTFPAFSSLHDRIHKVREGYLRTLCLISFISLPIGGIMVILAEDFTRLVLGEKWLPVVPALRILALWGMIRSIQWSSSPVFYGIGRPDIVTKLQFVELLFLGSVTYPLIKTWGILGASLGVLASEAFVSPFIWSKLLKSLECAPRDLFNRLVQSLISTVIMMISVYLVKMLGLNLFLLVGIAAVIYLSFIYLLDRLFHWGILAELEHLRRSLFGPVRNESDGGV